VEAFAHAMPLDLRPETRERVGFGGGDRALHILHHRDLHPVLQGAQRHPERRGALPLAGAREHGDEALLARGGRLALLVARADLLYLALVVVGHIGRRHIGVRLRIGIGRFVHVPPGQ
jgi:hypothetical protein